MFDDTWRWTDLDVRWLGEIARRNQALGAIINAARLTQGDGTVAYLTMMGVRLLELHRVLKPTGSIYLHCDPTRITLTSCMENSGAFALGVTCPFPGRCSPLTT